MSRSPAFPRAHIEGIDQGTGIDPANLEHMSVLFFTPTVAVTIPREHGGRLDVRNPPGEGTPYTLFPPPMRDP